MKSENFFLEAEVHKNRILRPWELTQLFKDLPAIQNISKENLKQ